MKLTFTFIVACLLVYSVMGQTEKTSNEFDKIQQYSSNIRDFENLEGIKAECHSLKDLPFNDFKGFMLKSAQTATQLMDSTVSQSVDAATGKISQKTIYTYNSSGKQTLNIFYKWDKSSSKWVSFEKQEYTYDSNGKNTLFFKYSWDIITSKWGFSGKYEWTYNSNGDLTLYIGYKWDNSSSNWVKSSKMEFANDSNGNNTLFAMYSWDIISNNWVGNGKFETTYDSNGKKTLWINYNWDNSSSNWVGYYKTEYTYDSNGNKILEITCTWNKNNSNDWVIFIKDEYTYDSNGNVTRDLSHFWSNSMWAGFHKKEYTYDSNGNNTMYTDYIQGINDINWVSSLKDESTYDANRNKTLYTHYIWDVSASKWIATNKYEYAYLNNNNKYVPLFNKSYTWNNNLNNWAISDQLNNYYSEHDVTGILNIFNADMKIYPNPVTNGFRVSGLAGASTITLSDMNGKVLFTKEVDNDEYVSTDRLQQGIYLVRINTGEGSIVKKLIKK